MRLIIKADYDGLSNWAAEHVIESINKASYRIHLARASFIAISHPHINSQTGSRQSPPIGQPASLFIQNELQRPTVKFACIRPYGILMKGEKHRLLRFSLYKLPLLGLFCVYLQFIILQTNLYLKSHAINNKGRL